MCFAIFQTWLPFATYLFLLLAPVLAFATCCWRAATEDRSSRSPWILLSIGMFLWSTGIFLSSWEEILQHLPTSIAWFSDFCFFLYGVPVLFAISSVAAEQRIAFFVWLDGVQAVLTGYLTYVAIFSVTPFADVSPQPVSATVLLLTYNVENLLLAGAATLRLLGQPRGKDRGFYLRLCIFLWVYCVMAWIYNAWAATSDTHEVFDVMVDLPFLLLAILCLTPASSEPRVESSARKHPLAQFIEVGSPIFYTVALVSLGISLVPQHFYVGASGIAVAIVVYATRSTALQGRYFRTQQALHEARDRLEKMTLTDALTGVANRRCFDQSLVLEWNRAIRHRHSLALLLIDIDHFKRLNDRYGHLVGDKCLAEIASALQDSLPRSGDLLARYGGEEFGAILPATDENGARSVAVKMQAAVRTLNISNESPTGELVTISIGVAVFDSLQTGDPADIVKVADRALYNAKEHGRNRIESGIQPA
jgi:diguanylate cyclase (GGDEF)-like protein